MLVSHFVKLCFSPKDNLLRKKEKQYLLVVCYVRVIFILLMIWILDMECVCIFASQAGRGFNRTEKNCTFWRNRNCPECPNSSHIGCRFWFAKNEVHISTNLLSHNLSRMCSSSQRVPRYPRIRTWWCHWHIEAFWSSHKMTSILISNLIKLIEILTFSRWITNWLWSVNTETY